MGGGGEFDAVRAELAREFDTSSTRTFPFSTSYLQKISL